MKPPTIPTMETQVLNPREEEGREEQAAISTTDWQVTVSQLAVEGKE